MGDKVVDTVMCGPGADQSAGQAKTREGLATPSLVNAWSATWIIICQCLVNTVIHELVSTPPSKYVKLEFSTTNIVFWSTTLLPMHYSAFAVVLPM